MQFFEKGFLTQGNTPGVPDSSWSAVRSALVADVLRRGDHLQTRSLVRGEIHGESMLPALWPGDVVEIESCSFDNVRSGEILLALRGEYLVLHRLIAPCTPNGFLLRGDSVPGVDPQFPPEALLGRLVRVVDEGHADSAQFFLRPRLGTGFSSVKWSRALGMLFFHCGWARRVALKLHSRQKMAARALGNPDFVTDLTFSERGML